MEGISSDINHSLPTPKDSSPSLPDEKVADPDHGAAKPTSTAAKTVRFSCDADRRKLPTAASAGTAPTTTGKVRARSADGCLVWAPRTWRPDLKPMLRYAVAGPNGQAQVKYLTWDQSKGEGLGLIHRLGEFLDTDDYGLCEPIWLRAGDWNHATICFTGYFEDDGEWEVVHKVFQYGKMILPTLSEKAIWTEKPSVEWVDLRFWDIKLRETFGVGPNAHRGKLRVVTHKSFGGGDFEMVMKIWPTPVSSKVGLENEMMVYRACDGTGITPEFVGHVTEEGRVIGMLTKYHGDAHKPETDDEKELCRTALHTLQTLTGWQRKPRANHKDNYLIEDGKALLIDLASVYPPDEVARKGKSWTQKLLHQDFDAFWDH